MSTRFDALAPADVAEFHPLGRALFISPLHGDGFTGSGIWVDYNEDLYPLMGRVIAVAAGEWDFALGDVVVFDLGAYEWVHLPDGRSFAVMDARAVRAILYGYDRKVAA